MVWPTLGSRTAKDQIRSDPSETPPPPISMSCQIYYYVPQGVDVKNLVGIDSAVTDLRVREKTRFVWIFLINTSVCLYVSPFLRRGYRSLLCLCLCVCMSVSLQSSKLDLQTSQKC